MKKWEKSSTPTSGLGRTLLPLVLALALLILGVTSLLLISGQEQEQEKEEALLRVEGVIVDAETGRPVRADVYLDGRLLYEGVAGFAVEVPKGSELRVEREGYHPWAFLFRYELEDPKVFKGLVRLKPKSKEEGK